MAVRKGSALKDQLSSMWEFVPCVVLQPFLKCYYCPLSLCYHLPCFNRPFPVRLPCCPSVLGDATDIRYQELTNCDLQMVPPCLLYPVLPVFPSFLLAPVPPWWGRSSAGSPTPWPSSRGVPSRTSSTTRECSGLCACCVACVGACQTLSESSFQDPEASEPAEAGDFKGKVVESKSTKEGPVNMFLLLNIFNLRLFLSLQRSHSCQVCEEADDNSGGISIHNIGGQFRMKYCTKLKKLKSSLSFNQASSSWSSLESAWPSSRWGSNTGGCTLASPEKSLLHRKNMVRCLHCPT